MVGAASPSVPLDLLGRLAVREEAADGICAAGRDSGAGEAVVLSTCSRTEIYVVGRAEGSHNGLEQRLVEVLAGHAGLAPEEIRPYLRTLAGEKVVAHLFRVAAGLRSRLVGDADVASQVRRAARDANRAGTLGPELGRVFAGALAAARRAHSQSRLRGLDLGRSLGRRAAELALETLSGSPASASAVVLGTGQMAHAVVGSLRSQGVRLSVCGRDLGRAETLAGRTGGALLLEQLPSVLADFDVVVCCTSAPEPIIEARTVAAAVARRRRPLVIVDLSVPRNVDPAVGGIAGVRLIDIEGLTDDPAVHHDMDPALKVAEAVVGEHVDAYLAAQRARMVGPFVAALRARLEGICRAELRRAGFAAISEDDLERAAAGIAAKLLHTPISCAREAAAAGDAATLDQLSRLLLPAGR